MLKKYTVFCGGLLAFMYATFAFTAFVHEMGHALCAWAFGEEVVKISLGSGPLLASVGGLLDIHAWLCGGLTSVFWVHAGKFIQLLVLLAGCLSVLCWCGFLYGMARRYQKKHPEVFHQMKTARDCSSLQQTGYGVLMCAPLLMLVMIGADLCPQAATDGSLINGLLGVSFWHPVLYRLWIMACYALQTFSACLFFIRAYECFCPLEIRQYVVEPLLHRLMPHISLQ